MSRDQARIQACHREAPDPDAMDPLDKIRRCATDVRAWPKRDPDGGRRAAGRVPEEEETLAKAIAGQLAILVATLARPMRRPRPSATSGTIQPAWESAPAPAPARPAPPPIPAAPRPVPPSPVAGTEVESPLAYWNFRDRLAAAIRAGKVRGTSAAMFDHAVTWGVNRATAAEWIERVCRQLSRDLARRQALAK